MATVLSKSPPAYNANNIAGTVKAATDYLRYLHENVDYLIGQLQKHDQATEKALSEMKEALSSLGGSIQQIEGEIAAIENNYTALELRVAALENAT